MYRNPMAKGLSELFLGEPDGTDDVALLRDSIHFI